jgi:hypothetical protein
VRNARPLFCFTELCTSQTAHKKWNQARVRAPDSCYWFSVRQVGSILQFVGGRIGALAGSGIAIGAFTVIVGVTPGQFTANIFQHPPAWVPWVSPALVILGGLIFWTSLRYNVWSQRQKVIDSLAEDMSFAIADLVNRSPKPATENDYNKFATDYGIWCAKVSKKLENRAFFTRADQLHFDRLGYLEPITIHGNDRMDWLHSQLKLKFERLRDVINWTQERRR